MTTTLTLRAKGPSRDVLKETQQTLATARLAVETVITDYGDDDGRTLARTVETLRRWEENAAQPALPGMEA